MVDIKEKLKELPTNSGVYLMLDEYGQILYVGKAKNLRNRVRQYFQNSTTKTEKTMLLVQKIADFRYIITNTEVEALVLENNLIKEHKPYYNILLKDDKSYPYIKITVKDKFPKIEVVRRLRADGSKYFGPYMLGTSPKLILELLHSVYPVRSCTGDISRVRANSRECLNYHIGRCLAPCVKKVSEEEYAKVIKNVIEFLQGNDAEVTNILTQKMNDFAMREEFEQAIRCRDNIELMDKLVRKQIINLPRDLNLDIFAYTTNGMYGVINYMVVRGGKMLGADNYPVDEAGANADIISSYIMQHYQTHPVLAEEILVSEELPFATELQDYLSHTKGKKVMVFAPKGGVRKQLVELAFNNATDNLEKTVAKIIGKEAMTLGAVSALQTALELKRPPKRMECYDISHVSGTDKVASMVVFINGEPSKDMYRRFRIKTVKGSDDFACMKEALSRRMGQITGTDPSFTDIPDLIIVDGGKGQLSSAYDIVGGYDIPLIGLAKREEEVFKPHISEPFILPRNSLQLTLLQRIRDEAHRFAITYHRALRRDRQTQSNLKNIEGVGTNKARALLVYFKKIENIAMASVKEIMEVDGFGAKNAQAVYDFYHKKGEEDNEV